eukprot:gene31380-6541_t
MHHEAHYNLQNFDEAQSLFEDIIEKDPHRLEGMDTLSNILFVKEQFVALSHLAHRAVAMDKYRPETCCIVGNYYSLKGEHEKAVVYFRRALHLDRSCLGAWTLMGHEYMEMKNTSAAIDAQGLTQAPLKRGKGRTSAGTYIEAEGRLEAGSGTLASRYDAGLPGNNPSIPQQKGRGQRQTGGRSCRPRRERAQKKAKRPLRAARNGPGGRSQDEHIRTTP